MEQSYPQHFVRNDSNENQSGYLINQDHIFSPPQIIFHWLREDCDNTLPLIEQHKSRCRDPVNHTFGDGAKTSSKQPASDQPRGMEAKLEALEAELKASGKWGEELMRKHRMRI